MNMGDNAMIIQIVDNDMDHPTPLYKFRESRKFKFLDIEEADHPLSISDTEAEQLVAALRHALANRMNVLVHCVAGICRSGAVVEVGVMMGFNEPEVYRMPNLLVKSKMMKVLELTYG
jgi:protein-tyrosine phosphatase